jgi:hypothetical protein
MLLPSHSHTSIEMMSIHIKNNLNIPQIGIFNKDVLALTIENMKKVAMRRVLVFMDQHLAHWSWI